VTDLPMPTVRQPHRAGPMPSVWKLLPGTGLLPYDCTPHGIASVCGGACCKTGWWPPKPNGACVHLDAATGCTLGDGRPVACHLYPLQVNANGTLVLHGLTRWKHTMCKSNRGAEGAPRLIDALRPGLTALFGAGEVAAAKAVLLAGREYRFDVPAWVLAAIAQETEWEVQGVPPERR
jgi:hypothetical protein